MREQEDSKEEKQIDTPSQKLLREAYLRSRFKEAFLKFLILTVPASTILNYLQIIFGWSTLMVVLVTIPAAFILWQIVFRFLL